MQSSSCIKWHYRRQLSRPVFPSSAGIPTQGGFFHICYITKLQFLASETFTPRAQTNQSPFAATFLLQVSGLLGLQSQVTSVLRMSNLFPFHPPCEQMSLDKQTIKLVVQIQKMTYYCVHPVNFKWHYTQTDRQSGKLDMAH